MEDTSPLLPPKQISLVQKIIGTFLYYSLATNSTMIVALIDLASTESKAIKKSTKMWRGY